ncbi:hypothetical protein DL93DRAFT_2078072 [Clavulina sp. PMI_390]|nr:hypothetical protein DL93DRAFT_2078072 [Clavulina sp. PMI_390]
MPLSKISGLVKRVCPTRLGLDSSNAHPQSLQIGSPPPLPPLDRGGSSPLPPLPVYPSIVHLPSDAIIEILSHSLLPRDLVSVSHVSNSAKLPCGVLGYY